MKKVLALVLAIGIASTAMIGCTSKEGNSGASAEGNNSVNSSENNKKNNGGENNNANNADNNKEDVAKDTSFTIKYPEKLHQQFGTELKLDKIPERVICMTAGPVQTLYELGVEMVAIPDSSITTWPEDLKAERLPFGMGEIDVEGIFALEPDFLILSTSNKEKYGKLFEEKGIPVYYVQAGPNVKYDDIKSEVKLLGEAFQKTEEMNKILDKFHEVEGKIEEAKKNGEAPSVLVLFGFPPSYMQTSHGYLGNMLNMLGSENVADVAILSEEMTSSIQLNMEELLNYQPDLVVAVSPSVKDASELETLFNEEFEKNSSVWSKVKAIDEGNILFLDSTFAKSSGIQCVESLEQLVDLIYE